MNFSEEQLEVIEAPIDEKTIVMAAAASGKTATLTERIRYLLKNGIRPEKIVSITFTNNAAAEMRERLGDDFQEGMFLGTLHSYVNMLLMSKGIDTTVIRDEEEFDELFQLIMVHPEAVREVDYLLCDESQDLNAQQFDFITTIVNPHACLIVGDIRQSIYGFRNAVPKMLLYLMNNDDYVVRELNRNYRNGTTILDFSNTILKKMKEKPKGIPIPMRDTKGTVKFIPKNAIITTLNTDCNWEHWAILCRSNLEITQIMRQLENADIPAITFKQAQGDLTELHEKMKSNAVKVLTIHSAKGLEFDKVIIHSFRPYGNEENLRVCYVAVTRARDYLYICKDKK